MESSLSYLSELLHSVQACTKSVDDNDDSISDSWEEVYRIILDLEKTVSPQFPASGALEQVVNKFREIMVNGYPDAQLLENPLLHPPVFSFKYGSDEKSKVVLLY